MAFPDVDNIYTEGETTCTGLIYLDPYLYALYFRGTGSPTYKPLVRKLDPNTYEEIDEWLAPYDARWAHSMCTDCEYLYVGMTHKINKRIYVWKVDPNTMESAKDEYGNPIGWYGKTYGTHPYAKAIKFDFQSKRLLVLEDSGPYRVYKLTQNLTEEMHKDAESGWPPSQYHGHDLTILGDYFYVASGGTPGEIIKRRISDLEMVDYFSGYLEEPDRDIEGIFFNVCNDKEYLYTATYDYSGYRPSRLIKIDPLNMSRINTFYGATDELMAYGSYAYGGKVYMLLDGWNGIYWGEPGYGNNEMVLQIDTATMMRDARYAHWLGDYGNAAYKATGNSSRLHVGFGKSSRSILQFAETGVPECIPWVGNKVALFNSKDKRFVEKIRGAGVGDVGMLINAKGFRSFLPKTSIAVGNTCKIFNTKDKSFARKI